MARQISIFGVYQSRQSPVAIIQQNVAFTKLISVNTVVASDLRKLPHILRIVVDNNDTFLLGVLYISLHV